MMALRRSTSMVAVTVSPTFRLPWVSLAVVHELAALVLLHVGDVDSVMPLGGDGAVVGHLAAHLGVEGGRVQDHDGLHAGDELVHAARRSATMASTFAPVISVLS